MTLTDHSNSIFDLIVLDNGYLVSSSSDVVKLWNANDGSLIDTISLPYPCYYMTPLSNVRFVCSHFTNGLSLLDADEGDVIESVEFSEEILGLVAVNNGQHIAGCAPSENKILIWNANDLVLVKTINSIDCFAYLSTLQDGNLAVGGNDGQIRILYTASFDF